MKILIVVDNKHVRSFVQEIGSCLQVDSRGSADGRSALQILETWAADIVIVDHEAADGWRSFRLSVASEGARARPQGWHLDDDRVRR